MRRLRKLLTSQVRDITMKQTRKAPLSEAIDNQMPGPPSSIRWTGHPLKRAFRNLAYFAAVEIIRGWEKTDSGVSGTVLTLLVRRQYVGQSGMTLSGNAMNPGLMRDDIFFTG